MSTLRTVPWKALALAAVAACADDANRATGDDGQPRFLVFSTVDTDDARLGYFAMTTSLDGDVPIDISKGIEEAGGGRLYVEPGVGTFMIGSGETPSITRYEVSDDGAFVRGETISFANQGVSNLADNAILFIDASTAYFRDRAQLQLIRFDPTRMEIVDTFPIEGVAREGFSANFGTAIRREDGVYFPMSYYDPNDYGHVPEQSVLVRLDPDTGETTVTSDSRCTSLEKGIEVDGDAYWFSSESNALGWRADPPRKGSRPDCALRVRAGETSFDPTYMLDVTTRTGGTPSLAAVPAGGSGIWFRVLDESLTPVPEEAEVSDIAGLAGWQWQLLDVASDAPATRNDDRPPGGYYTYGFVVDGRSFTTESSADYSSTKLIEITSAGFEPRAEVVGTVRGLARIR